MAHLHGLFSVILRFLFTLLLIINKEIRTNTSICCDFFSTDPEERASCPRRSSENLVFSSNHEESESDNMSAKK